MLILNRRVTETLMVGDNVTVTVMGIKGNQVRLAVKAPKSTAIHREEVSARIQKERENSPIVALISTDEEKTTGMLILTRRVGETLLIGDDVTLTPWGIKGGQVRIGIEAPKDVAVHREEIYARIQKKRHEFAHLMAATGS